VWWLLHAHAEQLHAVATGSTYDAVTGEDLGALRVIVPSAARQRAIAEYLDAETSRIDALMAKKRRMMDLLEERFWLGFLHRVRAVGTSQSQLRRALVSVTDGPFGSAFSSSDYSDEGAAVVRLGNIGFAEYRRRDQAYIPLPLWRTS
jgi:type I restriction enzyme, S subunit